ncbi:MAG: hypothetical protein KDM91_05555 [Verrucomicrobiae bacterium]|nr:hypothetical protein [Verrucomicrobiae bacterium]MCP5540521.1 hypothetical protein [Akkermansiaceae bacterium]MCP5550785.1 hypothetical protein [Akkermansiaceae bacterium]
MKHNAQRILPPLLILAAAMPGTILRAEDNIIRQTQLESGIQYDLVTSNNTGSAYSFMPIEEGGASYELYAYGSAWDTNLYFLDRKVIGHYLPRARITINTQDMWHDWFHPGLPPRTRADKPYTLAIKVWGLTDDDDAPLAAQKVLYTHVGQNYDETYTPNGNAEYVVNSFHMFNQEPNYTPVYTALVPMAPTKAMGIEKFTISSLADETIPETSILAEEMLTVWPVSEAFIDGVETGMTIRDSLPNLIIRYSDLYPLSWTYVQIYKGAPQLGKSGAIFNTTPRWHNTIVPQSEVLSIENWESMIGTDGQYTIEVVTITPFNNWQPERLSHVSFNIDRNVNVNGQVVTSEK